MTADASSRVETEWLTLPELVELTGESLGRVKRLIDESYLIGTRRDGVFVVPSVFLIDGSPIASLHGTIIVLHDAGFSDDEAIDWLLDPDDQIGVAPIHALAAGRKSEVRRVARTLA
ncbi:Rv2175c family DNA-binding protein [Microbacterium sp. C7(2022)]|uniref:Rv2175c family DNA-binding protein n=1 Tax=Microbacterium sp. C7(2022) TaxID=2992759 RepID=UPI00237BAF49|nr:Rv2175c family DNA-binding protein [Microbacterium sp. C7(2022)]MDE0546741.1 Rv2175c family DNA-binding protein [Microbacterium sp. C7(2022)]